MNQQKNFFSGALYHTDGGICIERKNGGGENVGFGDKRLVPVSALGPVSVTAATGCPLCQAFYRNGFFPP